MADAKVAQEGRAREADAWRPVATLPSETVLPAPRITGRLRAPRLAEMLAEERAYGHFFLLVPVFVGIGAALWFAADSEPPLMAIALFALAALVPAWRLRHREDWTALAAGAAVLVPAGMLLAALESARLATVILDSPVTTTVTGRVLSREGGADGAMRYRVALAETRDPKLKRPPTVVTLVARGRHEPVEIGAGIAGRARLSPPSGPALAGLNDFAFDAYFAGTGAVGFFYRAPEAVTMVGEASLDAAIRRRLAEWRAGLGAHIRGRIGGDAGAIAAALVTAEERAIGEETVEALRQAGLAHVLAISGLNMALAAGTFLVGARLLMALVPGFTERHPAKKTAAAGALVMVTLYILVSGGAISAVRSWIMISVMLVAVLFGRSAISLRNVALSAIVILIVTPSAVTGPGFQMSYAATLGLVAGYAALRARPVRHEPAAGLAGIARGGLGRFLRDLVLSSLIGGVATLIYSIGYFHRIPAYGLAGNLLAMPVIGLIVMPAGLAALLLMPLGLDAVPFAIMGQGIEAMIALATWVAGWQGEVVTGRIAPAAFLAIGLGGGLVCILRTRLRHIGTAFILAGIVLALSPDGARPPELLVSEDGRLVAILRDGKAATNRTRPPDFIHDQWRRALRLTEHLGPQMRRTPGLVLQEKDAGTRPGRGAVTVAKLGPTLEEKNTEEVPPRRWQLAKPGPIPEEKDVDTRSKQAVAFARRGLIPEEDNTEALSRRGWQLAKSGPILEEKDAGTQPKRAAAHAGPGLVPQEKSHGTDTAQEFPRRKTIDRAKAKDALAAAFAAARAESRFVCEAKAFCAAVSPSGWRVVTVEEPAFLGIACDAADLVVVPLSLKLDACRSGARLVTARHLRWTGALEIRPDRDAAGFAGAETVAAITTLDRPWARHRRYDWRSGRFEDGQL